MAESICLFCAGTGGVCPVCQREQALEVLRAAICSGDIESVRRLVDAEPKLIEAPTHPAQPAPGLKDPMHLAARYGQLHIVTFLAGRGMPVNATRIERTLEITPLFEAAAHGQRDVLDWLVQHGALVNWGVNELRFEGHATALHWAIVGKQVECAQYLLKHGADRDPLDEHGDTPLSLAIKTGYEPMVTLLRAHGCHTPLTAAGRRKSAHAIEASARRKPARLDLRLYPEKVRKLIEKAVTRYARLHLASTTAAVHPAVTGFGIVFTLEQSPGVDVRLDTRKKHDLDGSFTHHEFATLRCPEWERFVSSTARGRGEIIDLAGRVVHVSTVDVCEVSAELIGEMIVDVIKAARTQGVFEALPRAATCELSVEELEGMFGWPGYENRGRENIL